MHSVVMPTTNIYFLNHFTRQDLVYITHAVDTLGSPQKIELQK